MIGDGRPIEFSYAYRYGATRSTLDALLAGHITAKRAAKERARVQFIERAIAVSEAVRAAREAERRRA